MTGAASEEGATTLLIVCTGNSIRSPIAQAMMQAALEDRSSQVEILSAGLRPDPSGIHRRAAHELARRHLELPNFVPRVLTSQLVGEVDLVIGMERWHAREAAVLQPGAWAYSFTFRDVVRRAARVGPRAPGQPFRDWLEAVAEGHQRAALVGSGDDDGIDDPLGSGRRTFRRVAVEIEALVETLVDLAWPPAARD
jgi:protein-tyrosine-phosphatase